MSLSYEKLWAMLKDKKIRKTDVQHSLNMSPSTISKMSRNESVNVGTVLKLAEYLNCDIGDIVSSSPNDCKQSSHDALSENIGVLKAGLDKSLSGKTKTDIAGKSRNDSSFELWNDPIYADENKMEFEMNPTLGIGKVLGYVSACGINSVVFSINSYNASALKNKDEMYFKEDAIFLGKVLEGSAAINNINGKKSIVKEGDICCFSGNISLFYSCDHVKMIGVFGYYSEIIKTFKKYNWNVDLLIAFFSNSSKQNNALIKSEHTLHEIINSLYEASNKNDYMLLEIKGLELLYYVISTYESKKHAHSISYAEAQLKTVISIKEFLETNLDRYYSMPLLAQKFNISLSRMQEIFRAYYGMSPYKYHLSLRLKRARFLIKNTELNMSEISINTGFKSYNKFLKAYINAYGDYPSKDREETR